MLNGVLNIYKEPGFTSHDVVAKLRGILRQKKIGHTGTLDPDAEGVLPVCLGKATRLCDMLAGETKTYEAVLLLGVSTDTQDTSGKVLEKRDVQVTAEEAEEVLASFLGRQMQIPPMYSALKHNGKKLYELAREGKTIEREPRPVYFHEIRLLSAEMPRLRIRVTCSKGTYIRTLCSDVGDKLGCGGCMEHLTRTRVGTFHIEDALRLADVSRIKEEGELSRILVPVDRLFADRPALHTTPEQDALAHNGNPVPMEGLSEETQYRLYDSADHFIGICRADTASSLLKLEKMFYDPSGSD